MQTKYYTFISVNRKSIRVEETENEHKARMKRLRAIERAKKAEEERKKMGYVPNLSIVCQKCGNVYQYSTIPKYQSCPRCAILSMYD